MATSELFDFGYYGPVAPGAVAIDLNPYSAAHGYGWTSYINFGAESGGSNPLLSGFEAGTNSTFRVDLPNGTYSVTAYMGSYVGFSSDQIIDQGQSVATGLTAPGSFFEPTFLTTVTTGQMTLDFTNHGGSSPFDLNGLQISPGPTATIAGMPTASAAGTPITLTGSATGSTSSTPGFSYAWSVTKDGRPFATGSGPSFTFTPDDMGTFAASLVATDKNGVSAAPASATDATTDAPPTATISGMPSSSAAGTPITLTASATDPASAVAAAGFSYAWSVTKDGRPFATGSGPSFTFTPDDMGTFAASLVATDKNGGVSGPATATDATTDVPPTAQAGGPYQVTSGSPLQFQGSATDPVAAIAAAGFTYTWNFGDGSAGGGASPTHTYTAAGTYNVGLTVTDKNGGVATSAAVVTAASAVSTVQGSLLFDYGFYGPVAAGAVAINLDSYSPAKGYGWTSYIASGSETGGADPLLSGYESGTNSTFRVDLPDGVYSVTAYMGSYAGFSVDQVSYQGQSMASGTTAPGQFYEPAFPVTVTDGEMTLDFSNGGGSTPFNLNGLRIQAPLAASAGPDQSVNQGGTVSFPGEAFPGLGATYTWDFGDGSSETGTLAPRHAYEDGGNYTAKLTVADGFGDTTSSTARVSVAYVAPSVSVTGAPTSLLATGTTISLGGSATDPSTTVQAAGYAYSWNVLEDGVSVATGTGANFAFTPQTQGNYKASLTALDKDGIVGTSSVNFSAVNPSHLPTIVTPNDTIPNFVASPTIYSVASGNWSNPATWSGDRVPGTGDVVEVSSGTNVTYDEFSTARLQAVGVDPQATLQFVTAISTEMYVTDLVVFYGGTLQIGTAAAPEAPDDTATILFNNVPINTAIDPSEYGNGLIALGTVTIHGASKTPTFQPLATEAHAGDTTLQLSRAESGWRVGDQLYLPDSGQRDYNAYVGYGIYALNNEYPTIAGISADGKTVTVSSPLLYDHLGGRDADGNLIYLPDVVDMTRNVVIRSESGIGTRGQAIFTGRADVDVENASFVGLGRTTDSPADNTTYDASGNVTHVGTNEDNRTAVQFRDLVGPTTPQADGYQYTFVDNVVNCPVMNNVMIWPVTVNDSSYGLIQGNAVTNWSGAGIITETGAEVDNMISDNFVSNIRGTGDRFGFGREGAGYWFRGPDNHVVDNVATDIMGGTYSYGFVADFGYYLGNVAVPAYQGADPSVPGQSVLMNMNDTPLLDFSGDQVYGKTPNGVTFWWLGTFADDTYADARPSVIEDFQVWHIYQWGIFPYQSNKVTIDRFTNLGDATVAADGAGGEGIHFEDYYAYDMTMSNLDIQGQQVGINSPNGTIAIDGGYFQNVTDIAVNGLWTVEYTSLGVLPRNLVIDNVDFADFTAGGPSTYISMNFANRPNQNFIQTDTVLVDNYDQIAGDDFECYYAQQAPTYVIPETTYNADGSVAELGAPVAGLTNAQAWQRYGIAIAGKVANNATTLAKINGLVGPIS